MRSRGPYGDCSIDSSTRLHYHCYTTNDYGNTWTWVRVVGQDIAGWVWDENLQGYGSSVPAEFRTTARKRKAGVPRQGDPCFYPARTVRQFRAVEPAVSAVKPCPRTKCCELVL
ncbi:hypothetical protein F4560_005019 [Saccharothrix ecbatanensis]|uniref:Uncharacterized protein n=1 Tax=Saccharothrix ecbatanensis TaxID=1105145 RepID=A0A7W9HNH1_9PSEU|nr:hypothetical protein [Saccharothrix ecbatanensis]